MIASARPWSWSIPTLAAIGLADAGYLAALHVTGETPPCHGYTGCAVVNNSPYAEIFGVPVAALGTALYLVVLAVALWRRRAEGAAAARATLVLYALVLSAALFMAYLTSVEAFVLHAYCYWCLGLAAITFLLLGLLMSEVWVLSTRGASLHPRGA